jgi:hypothetical protein
MDFAGMKTLYVGSRTRPAANEWDAVLLAGEPSEEMVLGPVTSYAEAAARMRDLAADRLFISAETMAQMVTAGVGPTA